MQTALVLAERNFRVVLFEKEDKLGGTLNVADKPLLKDKIMTLVKITENGSVFKVVATGEEKEVAEDTIVLSLCVSPCRSVVEEFEAAFEAVKVLGDGSKGGRIVEAVADGFGKAYVL